MDPVLLAWATPIATLGLLAVTIAYSYFTYQLVAVGRLQRFESIRPHLQVAVVATQRGQFFVLGFENRGLSPAINFKATLDRDVFRTYGGGDRLNDVPFIRNGVPAFMPNTPVEIGLGVSHTYLGSEIDRDKHPARFEITADYEFEGQRLRERFPIEVHDLYAETLISQTEMTDLVKAIKTDIGTPLKEAVRQLKARERS
jgi:hypothetical protein